MSNELSINITAEIDGLKKGLDQAEKEIKGFSNESKNIDSVGDSFSDLGNTIGKNLVPELSGAGKTVDTLGDSIGGLGEVATEAGVSMFELGDIARNLGLNKAADFFDILGGAIGSAGGSATLTIGALSGLPIILGVAGVAIAAIVAGLKLWQHHLDGMNAGLELFKNTMNSATSAGQAQVAQLDRLYKAAQDTTKSQNERNKAVDDMIKLAPQHLSNLDREAIKTGTLGDRYLTLTQNILKASRAKAAQAEVDKAEAVRLAKEIEIRKKLNTALADFKAPKEKAWVQGSGGVMGGTTIVKQSAAEVKKFAQQEAFALIQELGKLNKDFNSEMSLWLKAITDNYVQAAVKTEEGGGKVVSALSKVNNDLKNELPPPLFGSENYYKEELKKLEKIKEAAVIGSKIWTDTLESINNIKDFLNPPDFEPFKSSLKTFVNEIGMEFDTLKGKTNFLKTLGNEIELHIKGTSQRLKNAAPGLRTEAQYISNIFKEMSDNIEMSIGTFIGDSVSDMFSSIGEALGSGGNVIAAIGQSLLASLSGFLSNMGKMMAQYGGLLIAYGVAEEVLKKSPDGISKIAAGAALVAIGSALSLAGGAIKGASSSGGGSASGGAGGGTSSYSSSYSSGGAGGGNFQFVINGMDLVSVVDKNRDRMTRLNAG